MFAFSMFISNGYLFTANRRNCDHKRQIQGNNGFHRVYNVFRHRIYVFRHKIYLFKVCCLPLHTAMDTGKHFLFINPSL